MFWIQACAAGKKFSAAFAFETSKICTNQTVVCVVQYSHRSKQGFGYHTSAGVQMVQEQKRAAIYCRVSTDDQSCDRQVRDLTAFAERAGYTVVAVHQETASGANNNRAERAKVMKLAQSRRIDAILVTEMTRWGRSTVDLLETLQSLHAWNVSVVALTGMQFELSTPQGKMMAAVLAALSEFERDLICERTKSGLAAAKARGKRLGRQEGQNPSDKYAKKVLSMVREGRSYRDIADNMNISKTTVQAIVKRHGQPA